MRRNLSYNFRHLLPSIVAALLFLPLVQPMLGTPHLAQPRGPTLVAYDPFAHESVGTHRALVPRHWTLTALVARDADQDFAAYVRCDAPPEHPDAHQHYRDHELQPEDCQKAAVPNLLRHLMTVFSARAQRAVPHRIYHVTPRLPPALATGQLAGAYKRRVARIRQWFPMAPIDVHISSSYLADTVLTFQRQEHLQGGTPRAAEVVRQERLRLPALLRKGWARVRVELNGADVTKEIHESSTGGIRGGTVWKEHLHPAERSQRAATRWTGPGQPRSNESFL